MTHQYATTSTLVIMGGGREHERLEKDFAKMQEKAEEGEKWKKEFDALQVLSSGLGFRI